MCVNSGGGVVFSGVLGHVPMKAYEEDHKNTISLQVSLQSETSFNTDAPVPT